MSSLKSYFLSLLLVAWAASALASTTKAGGKKNATWITTDQYTGHMHERLTLLAFYYGGPSQFVKQPSFPLSLPALLRVLAHPLAEDKNQSLYLISQDVFEKIQFIFDNYAKVDESQLFSKSARDKVFIRVQEVTGKNKTQPIQTLSIYNFDLLKKYDLLIRNELMKIILKTRGLSIKMGIVNDFTRRHGLGLGNNTMRGFLANQEKKIMSSVYYKIFSILNTHSQPEFNSPSSENQPKNKNQNGDHQLTHSQPKESQIGENQINTSQINTSQINTSQINASSTGKNRIGDIQAHEGQNKIFIFSHDQYLIDKPVSLYENYMNLRAGYRALSNQKKEDKKIRLQTPQGLKALHYFYDDPEDVDKYLDFVRHYIARLLVQDGSLSNFAKRNKIGRDTVHQFLIQKMRPGDKSLSNLWRIINTHYKKPLDVTRPEILELQFYKYHKGRLQFLDPYKNQHQNNESERQARDNTLQGDKLQAKDNTSVTRPRVNSNTSQDEGQTHDNALQAEGQADASALQSKGTELTKIIPFARSPQIDKKVRSLHTPIKAARLQRSPKVRVLKKDLLQQNADGQPDASDRLAAANKGGASRQSDTDHKRGAKDQLAAGNQLGVNNRPDAGHRLSTDSQLDETFGLLIINIIYKDDLEALVDLLKHARAAAEQILLYDGNGLVHYAAKYGALSIMQHLLDEGANKDAINSSHETPLLWAIESLEVDMVQYLLERGAKPNGAGRSLVRPPLHEAIVARSLPSVKLLVDYGADMDKRHHSSAVSYTDANLPTVELPNANGSEVEWPNANGFDAELFKVESPSFESPNAEPANSELVLYDTQVGIREKKVKNLFNAKGQTALELALSVNNPEIIEYLQQHRAQASQNLLLAYNEYKNIVPEKPLQSLSLKQEHEQMIRDDKEEKVGSGNLRSLWHLGCEALLSLTPDSPK